MKTVGLKLKCNCHGLERFIVKHHPRLGLLCQQGADGLKEEQPKEKDWKEECWKWFSKYTRLFYADKDGMCQCFTCHVIRHWTKLQCGHGIPRQHEATFLEPKNNHPQCGGCNGFEGGRQAVYKVNVDKKYGAGTWDKLELLSKTAKHRSEFEWKVLANYYKQEFQKLQFKNKAA